VTEWTQEELRQGQRDIQSMDGAHVGWDNVAVRLACQRNRALAALKVIVAHEYAAALELKRDLDMPDIELPWMKQAIAAIAACTEGK
jgi:hypothetical protein